MTKIEPKRTYSELEEEAVRNKMVIFRYFDKTGKRMVAFVERGKRFRTQDGREYEIDQNGSLRRIVG